MKIRKPLYLLFALPSFLMAEEITMEERRQSVAIIREQLEMRENRLAEVTKDLRAQGDDIDRRIGKIVDSLSKLKDSEASTTRISRIKADAAKQLMNMIKFYQAEREKLVQKAKTDEAAPIEGIAKDVARIDEMVQKRSEQIVKLVNSIPGEKDVDKYEVTDSSYVNGWVWENSQISEEWRQNRRDKVQSTKARREARQALEQSIEDLERRLGAVRSKLKGDDLGAVQREIQNHELDYLENLLKVRKQQLVEVSRPQPEPSESVPRDKADDLKQLFADASGQIREDFVDALRIYRSAVVEREKLARIRLNLKAREEWLKVNDTGGTKGK
ncbi:MAG: hypothetical protein P1U90_13635 [Akkermansiaceae bacterium]|nr:hypothetical protein [Akkermansiaceae bacterium]